MVGMNRRARREEMRGWIALRNRERLTIGELSSRSGFSRQTLYRWTSRLRGEGDGAAPLQNLRAPSFVELVERVERPRSPVELVLRGERLVRVPVDFDETSLMRLVRALERAC